MMDQRRRHGDALAHAFGVFADDFAVGLELEEVHELAGDSAYTLAEFAAELARQAGKPVPYVNLPQAEFKAVLQGAGLPEPVAELLSDSDAGVAQGGLFDAGHQLSTLLGRSTTPMAVTISAALRH